MSTGVEARKRKRNIGLGSGGKSVTKSRKSKRTNAHHSSSEEEDVHDEGDGREAQDEYEMSDGSGSKEDGDLQLPNLTADGEPAHENDSADVPTNDDGFDESDQDEESDEDEQSDASSEDGQNDPPREGGRKLRKRNDPSAFATSISRILDSKLSTAKRADPVLSRSKDASTTSKEVAESRLEAKAKKKLKEDKREALEKGRVKDVLGVNSTEVSTSETVELEKRLRKTAQRGVIKLFNAVRAAQVKAEQAAREAQDEGVIGVDQRQERVNEMSKKGFLDLLAEG